MYRCIGSRFDSFIFCTQRDLLCDLWRERERERDFEEHSSRTFFVYIFGFTGWGHYYNRERERERESLRERTSLTFVIFGTIRERDTHTQRDYVNCILQSYR